MTRDQIARVRSSWALVVPVADTFAALCYERLFALDPSLRPVFARVDLATLQRKLMQTLGMVVASIDDLDQLVPALGVLGQRHMGYGLTDAHYRTMRDAIVWTLGRALGDVFDNETRQAWQLAYDRLVTAMRCAAAGSPGTRGAIAPHALDR